MLFLEIAQQSYWSLPKILKPGKQEKRSLTSHNASKITTEFKKIINTKTEKLRNESTQIHQLN